LFDRQVVSLGGECGPGRSGAFSTSRSSALNLTVAYAGDTQIGT
jgi:hypothetical protein